ncbi:1097_t:CDS:2 [Entrophospora sp. SA101]|nr:1096_t:CDS:2 [Entrophospora sp. SA101]CAJ0745703.1 1097_t:CDS:2 [Entrophospora sp. SA101]CAJ0825477.1 13231_t:CDS:2 [Entrophospora sp. SA101]CAJ0825480.1 13232_t:CDS:2 [Entrophospora sp. SA101]CAJ0839601.1 12519_t:CDS:2 [Entrophospora sp. SA101]
MFKTNSHITKTSLSGKKLRWVKNVNNEKIIPSATTQPVI